ncbi:uncharacterized protein LOC126703426 [Quercus robur]|uniref:uncharacterized protein LOC126703426 n=1 Tax=Quercus robur TaxID=38942 RepID=UPI0021632B72|nr:uncharacterized protein LOC126703426 [Quercus robur]
MKIKGLVIRDVSVRSSQQASNENVDHESQQEIDQSSTVNPSNAPNPVVPLPVRATRGANNYLFIWNLPENHKIELPLTSSNQPIKKAGRNFTSWLGTIARKPHLCPIKYKNWTRMPDEFKEQIWDIVQSKWILPEELARLEAMKNRTLSSIAKSWKNHKSTLKKKYFLGRGNRARVPPNVIYEDYEDLVQYWSLPKTKELALKNKNSRSKQTNVHTGGSKNFASYVEEMVTTLGHLVEHADVYVKLHLHKDGTLVNTVAEGNISSDLTGSIAWAPDDVYAQVFGNERNGRVRGVGFGPTPSMHPAKSTPAIAQVRSQESDAKVTQLKNQVASLTEKVNRYENLEERMTQLMQLVQNQQNHSSKASWGGFSLDYQSPTPYRSQALSHQETSI